MPGCSIDYVRARAPKSRAPEALQQYLDPDPQPFAKRNRVMKLSSSGLRGIFNHVSVRYPIIKSSC
jgi:hypothetical protein